MAAPAGGAPAGGAGDGQQRQQGGGSIFGLLVQGAIIYYLMSNFLGGKSGSTSSGGAPGPAAVATPTPIPQADLLPPAGGGGGGGGLMDMLTGKMQKPVLPDLRGHERARRGALSAVPSGTALRNLWPQGTTFDLHVFVSGSADPLSDFPPEDAPGAGGDTDVAAAVRARASARATGGVASHLSFQSLFSEGSNLFDIVAPPPAIEYPNATFTSLVHPPPGTDLLWRPVDGAAAATTTAPADAPTSGGGGGGIRTLPDSPFPLPTKRHAPVRLWTLRGLTYSSGGDAPNYRQQHFNVSLPPEVATGNATLWAHIYFVAAGSCLDADEGDCYSRPHVFQLIYPLVTHLKQKPRRTAFNLLGGGDEAGNATAKTAQFGIGLAPEGGDGEGAGSGSSSGSGSSKAQGGSSEAEDAKHPLPYWRPTLHIQLVDDATAYSPSALPPHILSAMHVLPRPQRVAAGLGVAPVSGGPGYYPVALVNDFWLLNHDLLPLNGTTTAAAAASAAEGEEAAASMTTVPLTVSFSLQAMWRWALMAQMATTFDMQTAMGSSREGESDIFKQIVLETNPILLTVTLTVSVLHSVFDMLAFKNDIAFWRAAKSLEGLSVRSLVVNLFFQVVIALYLLENETSWMILASTFVGLAIEVWKLKKAVTVSLTWSEGGWPRIAWGDAEETYASSRTKEYDDIATNHMLYILYPLVGGYAVYSLMYDRHRSWYSWVLSSLTGFVYTFGFIQMVPQLYINYRLKSVAHMPWRAMVYKSLNTFIDDLFAWVIKMPTLHRIAVFRDDIIFLIYLYQRWIYPVDRNRRNEFGTSADDLEVAAARAKGEARVPRRSKWEKRGAVTAAAPVAAAGGSGGTR